MERSLRDMLMLSVLLRLVRLIVVDALMYSVDSSLMR